MIIKKEIRCYHCRKSFKTDDASMCSHISSDGTATLECPHCGSCACDRLDEWRASGKLIEVTDRRFDFVHEDLIG